MNALTVLIDPEALGRDIRRAAFMSTRLGGVVSVRQLELGLGLAEKAANEDAPLPRAQLEGMLREAAGEGLFNGAKAALAALDRLVEVLKQKVDVMQRVDFRPLIARLKPLAAFFTEVVPEPVAEGPAMADEVNAGAAPAMAGTAPAAPPGEIRSRDDVIRMLGKICDFLERNEPTNPAPLLLRRAERLMTMSFVDILKDVAPEGLPSVNKIAGLPGEEK